MEARSQRSPKEHLQRIVTDHLGRMRDLGFEPNRGVAFDPDTAAGAPPDLCGWLIVDPRSQHERWLLFEDGDVWHEVSVSGSYEGGPQEGRSAYEWLWRPTGELVSMLGYSYQNAKLGGSGFLSDEERFSSRPYVVGDRRRTPRRPAEPKRRTH
jgi:hypothetical protein